MLAAPSLLFVTLIPAILELKKPKDGGPYRIMADFAIINKTSVKFSTLMDLEENQELDISVKPFVQIILGALSNLEP